MLRTFFGYCFNRLILTLIISFFQGQWKRYNRLVAWPLLADVRTLVLLLLARNLFAESFFSRLRLSGAIIIGCQNNRVGQLLMLHPDEQASFGYVFLACLFWFALGELLTVLTKLWQPLFFQKYFFSRRKWCLCGTSFHNFFGCLSFELLSWQKTPDDDFFVFVVCSPISGTFEVY